MIELNAMQQLLETLLKLMTGSSSSRI